MFAGKRKKFWFRIYKLLLFLHIQQDFMCTTTIGKRRRSYVYSKEFKLWNYSDGFEVHNMKASSKMRDTENWESLKWSLKKIYEWWKFHLWEHFHVKTRTNDTPSKLQLCECASFLENAMYVPTHKKTSKWKVCMKAGCENFFSSHFSVTIRRALHF
jgi:hypothetical protein